MRYTKGSMVEVLSRKELPSGWWRCAEILRGNGRKYDIRYENCSSLTRDSLVDRVSRKAIRPYPPRMEGVEIWVSGDVVEVFTDLYWRMAMVVRCTSRNSYVVRLIGSSREIIIKQPSIRVRQSWEDGKWVVIGKGQYQRRCEIITSVKEAGAVSNFQRSLYNKRKTEAPTNDYCSPSNKRQYMESDFSLASSVGSCSINDMVCIQKGIPDDTAESSRCRRRQGQGEDQDRPFLSLKTGSESVIRCMELNAYRNTLFALYATGPLSWEQEGLKLGAINAFPSKVCRCHSTFPFLLMHKVLVGAFARSMAASWYLYRLY